MYQLNRPIPQSRIVCLWVDPSNHPQCSHGPTLLFGKYFNKRLDKFYACSACRNRKLCNFYLGYTHKLLECQKKVCEQEQKHLLESYPHQKLYICFNKIKAKSVVDRCYCHSCEQLILNSAKDKHTNHEIKENVTDHEMHHPTELLKPLNNPKKEAQYLFSKKSTKDIVHMLLKLEAKQILCIGTPRIHEYIIENHKDKMSSLLLDFDARFHNFFGPLEFCWYNLFNNHFFNKDAVNVFKDFITQNEGKDTYLICDPPFGGRVEPISYTLKSISDLHKKLNGISDDNLSMKIMFIFPYFMENIMREKSNPPSVTGGLKDLKMSDYKVDYDNHPMFTSGLRGRKHGSPIRIFTNIPLKLLQLPAMDDYKFCKDCEKWVSSENKHCEQCNECTAKDGRTYKHCNICERCVKSTWEHCYRCRRCTSKKHDCELTLKLIGRCFKCNAFGHTWRECPNASFTDETNVKKKKTAEKHKAENELKTSSVKKEKIAHVEKPIKQEAAIISKKKNSKFIRKKNSKR